MQRRWTQLAGIAAIALVVGAFASHRMLVILSAGDFLFPLEPWEGKNTQIAWDLFTGRFGRAGFTLSDYVTNNGAVHHASYSTTSLAYLLVAKVCGFGLLGVRVTPLLFWTAAILLWMVVVRQSFGNAAATIVGIGLVLVPTSVIAWQLTFFGCHSEAVLPLAAALGSWSLWFARGGRGTLISLVTGFCASYAVAFSYLLWPVVGLALLVTLLPPRPTIPPRHLGALAAGAIAGLWPLWLILALNPPALFTYSVTEDATTRVVDLATGTSSATGGFWTAFTTPFRGFIHDYWLGTAHPGKLWGGSHFEGWSWRITIGGPLLLIPVGWIRRRTAAGRLALVVATAPVLSLAFVAYGTPFGPDLPLRYALPLAFLGWSAPGLAVGMGLHTLREKTAAPGARIGGIALVMVPALALLWSAPPRLQEATRIVQLDRAGPNLEHRYVHYYNLGIGTVWSEQVAEVNDLLDVRAAQGDPGAFAAIQAGLQHDLRLTGLTLETWSPLPLQGDSIHFGLHEWSERQQYLDPHEREFTAMAAENIGWGVGIRARWQAAGAATALSGAVRDGWWPDELEKRAFWEGYGMGWARASTEATEEPSLMPRSIPAEHREAVARGVQRGRALGAVNAATGKPVFRSIRKPAQ